MDLGENSEKVEECILLSFKLCEEMEHDEVDSKLLHDEVDSKLLCVLKVERGV